MKASSTVPKTTKLHKFEPLPDPPVSINDTPQNMPVISQHEIVSYSSAEYTYQIARADFEMKRSALILKLLQGCKQQSGGMEVRLDEEGRLITTDHNYSGCAVVNRS